MPKSVFEILEIEPTQDLSKVKTAYKKRALLTHPDKFSASSRDVKAEKEALFKELGLAYEQVNDEDKLTTYFQAYRQQTNVDMSGFFHGVFNNSPGPREESPVSRATEERERELREKHEAERAAAEWAAAFVAKKREAEAQRMAEELMREEFEKNALQERLARLVRERLEREFQERPEQQALALEKRYNTALDGLAALQFPDHPEISKQVRLLINYVRVLHGEKKGSSQLDESIRVDELTRALENTTLLLTGKLNHDDYVDIANSMEGRPDFESQDLGRTLLALALVLAIFCVVSVLIFLLAPAVVSIVFPIVLVPVAVIPAVAGIGFFVAGRRQGLSKEMDNVNDASMALP